jgi:RimJ/RimL family protein N-acetyltransferase
MIEMSNTERLSFRLLNDGDAELFFDLDSDPEVMRFINGGRPSTLDDIHNIYIPRLISYTDPEKGWGMWGAFITESSDFAGWILVRPMHFFSDNPEWENLELGWRFKRAYWGKGIATEAAVQVANTIANDYSVKKFSAIADENNLGSIKIMKKLGMSFVKQYLHHDPLGDIEVVYYEKVLR